MLKNVWEFAILWINIKAIFVKNNVVMATCPDYIQRRLIHVSLSHIRRGKITKYANLIALSLTQYYLSIGPGKGKKIRHSLDNTNISQNAIIYSIL